MADPKFPSGSPLIGQKPRQVEVKRPIVSIILNDKDGSATVLPQDDITPIECFRITHLLFYCTTQPPPFENQRGEIVITWTPWRQYILDNKLERHFAFGMSVPLTTPGHA